MYKLCIRLIRKEVTTMVNDDTIKLLRECNSGIQMAVYSIDEVLDNVKDSSLLNILTASKEEHEKLGDETHSLLAEYGDTIKEPSALAKGMSWMKTTAKLAMEESDATVTDLITDGCNMGIKSLYRYRNQYQGADAKAKSLSERLIRAEEDLRHELRDYL